MLAPMEVVICCELISKQVSLLRGGYGGGEEEEGEGRPSCLESERGERRHREAGRECHGPVRVVGRRHGRGRRLAASVVGV